VIFRKKPHVDVKLGAHAEQWAQQYLETQGLAIVANNYRSPRGEIDLIMREENTLIFVEVRLRSNKQFGSAADSIDARKQQHLIHAAQHYLQSKKLWDQVPCRFDAICLIKDPDNGNKYQVEWLRNAFST
jgi:putative endonuclease